MKTTPCSMGKLLAGLGVLFALGTLPSTVVAEYRAEQVSVVLHNIVVMNALDQRLGRVKDLALDVEHGRIVGVMVASGGFLGFGEKIVAVPPGAIWHDLVDGAFRIDIEKARFEAAPAFKMSKWAENFQSRHVAEFYRYFGQKPYFAADGQDSPSGTTATEPLGHIERSSKLMNFPIQNKQDENLGSIANFLYNIPTGKLLSVIVQSPGFLLTKSVIPATALKFDAARGALILDLSKQAFKDEPRMKYTYGSWFNESQTKTEFKQETYENTKIAANDGVNTRQNFLEGTIDRYTPLRQGTSFNDIDKTFRIYAAIRADLSLSQNAQDIEVGTLNGRVTLRGHVNAEEGKRIIGEISDLVARPENVSNLLEVRPVPPKDAPAN